LPIYETPIISVFCIAIDFFSTKSFGNTPNNIRPNDRPEFAIRFHKFLSRASYRDNGSKWEHTGTNNLNDSTTIHWHGMHVSPENDGGPHIVIPPGETWSPEIPVLDWAATYWYHPHLHMHTNDHVLKGMAGLVIVKDDIEGALTLPRTYGIDDIPLVIQTKEFDTNNQISLIDNALDTALMVNGTLDPVVAVPAQVVRFRVLNGSSMRTYNLDFQMVRPFIRSVRMEVFLKHLFR
jgi:FtsP/CotA-like multicopper oxidase with cupredoxin domain